MLEKQKQKLIISKFLFILCYFLFQFSHSFSKKLDPKIENPQNTNRNSHNNNNNPRHPNPHWDHTAGLTTHVEHTHFVHQTRPQHTPHYRIQCIKGRGQETVQFRGENDVVPPRPGQRPRVLARAGQLCEDEQREYGARAVGHEVPARDEDEERGEVVADEEEVARAEGEVVEEVHGEVGNAEVEDWVLGLGVRGGEAAVRVGEYGGSG